MEVEQSGKGGKQRTLNRSLTVEVERGEEAVEHGGGGASVGAGDEVEQRQQRRLLAAGQTWGGRGGEGAGERERSLGSCVRLASEAAVSQALSQAWRLIHILRHFGHLNRRAGPASRARQPVAVRLSRHRQSPTNCLALWPQTSTRKVVRSVSEYEQVIFRRSAGHALRLRRPASCIGCVIPRSWAGRVSDILKTTFCC